MNIFNQKPVSNDGKKKVQSIKAFIQMVSEVLVTQTVIVDKIYPIYGYNYVMIIKSYII